MTSFGSQELSNCVPCPGKATINLCEILEAETAMAIGKGD
jgi:hypothetical protein